MKNYIIGKKKFTTKEISEFAKISNDYNPIHIDPTAARRLVTGNQVVHGINLMLAAINLLHKNLKKLKFNRIKCIFIKPVNVNEKVNFECKRNNKSVEIYIKNKSTLFTTIILEKNNEITNKKFNTNNTNLNKIYKINKNYINSKFKKIDKNNRNHLINLDNFIYPKKYKNLKKNITTEQFKAILSLSYFVGMVYPGLNSLLSSIDINLSDKKVKNNKINFSLKKYDSRINLLLTNFSNNIFGEIKAFIHQGEVSQPSLKIIKKFVKTNEFIGTNSLIIGGSRGLGELTSKILVLGNSKVTLTYFKGVKEAYKIKRSILSTKKKQCKLMKLDIQRYNLKNLAKKFSKHDLIFYYATPKILPKRNSSFDKKLFKEYKKFYVDKFLTLCKFIESYSKNYKIIFYPSTIYTETKPKHLKEYVEAKLMGEKMIRKLNSNLKKVKIISYKLPRLATDQTAGVINNFKNENIKFMLPIIKSIVQKKKECT